MALLLIFAFVSGFVTALTPCVLPILPIVLSSTLTGGKRRPLGVILGLIVSFTFFTLGLTAIVDRFHLPPDLLRNAAIVLIFIFGLSMVIPYFAQITERWFSRLSGAVGGNGAQRNGFWGGVLIGLTVGLLWVPCAGPILAAVITLAATQQVTLEAVLITFAYVCGSAVVLLLIAYGGKEVLGRFRSLNKYSAKIQQFFGVVMILASLALAFNIDRKFQVFIVQRLPSWAVTPLAAFESSGQVVGELQKIKKDNRQQTTDNSKSFDRATLLSNYGSAPEFAAPTAWLNSPPLTIQGLRGKVVLIDFWTYSCINCIRTLPYVESWQKKYADKGFTVVGVHSPEFAFEKVQSNVEKAIKDFGLTYPVVMDNDFGTWQAYDNHYWPAHYLIDANGVIRRFHFGEGDYENMERAIQLLLAERGVQADFDLTKEQKTAADMQVSPETYVGYKRMDSDQFRSNERVVKDQFAHYSFRNILNASQFGLDGMWNIASEFSEAKAGSKIRYHFVGKEINLVMGDGSPVTAAPAASDTVCTDEYCKGSGSSRTSATQGKRVKVTIMGTNERNNSHDVQNGVIFVQASQLYNLGKFATFTDATVELEFLDDGVQVYAYTFG